MIHHSFVRVAIVLGLAASALVLAPRVEAAEPLWTVTPLQPLPGDTQTWVFGINNNGMSVGWSGSQPVRWNAAGVPTALAFPAAGCTSGSANAISDSGFIVGITQCPGLQNNGTLWLPNGTALSIETAMSPTDVTNDGIVVGERYPPGSDYRGGVPFAYIAGLPRLDLPMAGAAAAHVADVTDFGYVVGTLRDLPGPAGTPPEIAVGWYGSSLFPLIHTSQPTFSVDVNAAGHALVSAAPTQYASTGRRGYLVAPGGAVTPLAHPGVNDTHVDINDPGIVLGYTQPAAGQPTAAAFYAFGGSVRLDALVSPADRVTFGLRIPVALNDHAWVVGRSQDGGDTSWLLKPPAA